MTRVPWAVWTPATFDPAYPTGKHYPLRSLDEILYVVNHDAQGYRGYLEQGHGPGREASWTFSNLTDGTLLEHSELEEPTWTQGGPVQNKAGVSVEHESLPDMSKPITPEQVATDQHLFSFLKTVCPNLRAPLLLAGFREHTELTNGATTCPSGRINPLYRSYLMAPLEEEDMDINTPGDWLGDGTTRTLGQALARLLGLTEDNKKGTVRVHVDLGNKIKALKAGGKHSHEED